jgi:lipoprotein-anchoring transpeptidase ErfK/SrfK
MNKRVAVAILASVCAVWTVSATVVSAEPMPLVVPATSAWRGEVHRAANVRAAPHLNADVVREVAPGTAVQVERWVAGDVVESDNPTWAEIAPGQFVYAASLRPGVLPEPIARPDRANAGKWIDVDLTHQVVTAYDGATAVHTTFASTGRPGWETPTGEWPILRRVADETMDGASLAGQGPDGKGATYRVESVRWTQYFTDDGSAIHENYWRDPSTFGIPGSHGCIGLTPAEAAWFWSWATTGTSVVVR